MKKTFFILFLILNLVSCVSTKSTLQNVDNNAEKPKIVNNAFVITEKAADLRYGYNKDYPINLGFDNEYTSAKNIELFFNGLAGENNEKIMYQKVDDCCPFPTVRSAMGAGMLVVYEVFTEGNRDKKRLYFNIFDKGKIVCPAGFYIKK